MMVRLHAVAENDLGDAPVILTHDDRDARSRAGAHEHAERRDKVHHRKVTAMPATTFGSSMAWPITIESTML